jgi:hypothetical protein
MSPQLIRSNFTALGILILVCACSENKFFYIEEIPKSRVIVLTDMLNEADDSQTMVRLLMYANRIDIEGLIAVSSCHQFTGKNDPIPARNGVHPEEIEKSIRAYALVLDNLKLHQDEWPEPEYLIGKVGSGPPEFGMLGVGEGRSTSGSLLICEALLEDNPNPLNVCINAGASCLAQALFDLNDSLDDERFLEITGKLRVYDDAGQDNAGAWIAHQFPHIRYQRSSSQVFTFYNNDGPATWDTSYYPGEGQAMWARENIQFDHGPLGGLGGAIL